MNKITILGISIVFLASLHAKADTLSQDEANALTIKEISVREVVPTAQELFSLPAATPPTAADPGDAGAGGGAGAVIGDINQIVEIGTKIYDIIKANAPVVNIQHTPVSVVPKGVTDWTQLDHWQAPLIKVYEITAKNIFGMTTVSLRLKLTANYGGNYRGLGKFLANVDLITTEVSVWWGYTVDVSVEDLTPLNIGVRGNPVAGLPVNVHYRIRTILRDHTGEENYWLEGNGNFKANHVVN